MSFLKNRYLQRAVEYQKIYQQEILPILRREEHKRIDISNKIKRFWFFVICLYIIDVFVFPVLILHFGLTDWYMPVLWVLFIIASVVLTLYHPYDKKEFLEIIKAHCLPRILRAFGDINWANGSGCIGSGDLDSSALFGNFDEKNVDDEFIGTYKDVDFKICEAELIKVEQTKNGEERKRIFKGIILSFEANKVINNRTIIATKGDVTQKNAYLLSIFPTFCVLARIILEFDGLGLIFLVIALVISIPIAWAIAYFFRDREDEPLNPVYLEDPKFSKRFNVYSSDQVEARYLLTTAFVDRFQNLKTAFGAKKIKCSFFGNQIMFAISTNKNLFEVADVNIPLTDPRSINELYSELTAVYKIIDYFKLDQKTGL